MKVIGKILKKLLDIVVMVLMVIPCLAGYLCGIITASFVIGYEELGKEHVYRIIKDVLR